MENAATFDVFFFLGILNATGQENRISGVRDVPRFLSCHSVSKGISELGVQFWIAC